MSDALLLTASPPARSLPWPAPWAELFGRPGDLVIEIGFGGGHFLIDLAQKRPSANVLGVEISLPSLRRGEQKRRRARLTNLGIVQGDGQQALWLLCAPGDVAALYINFPDPWPKARHHRRRLINDDFLTLAATRLRPGADLDIATDHADYAVWIGAALGRSPYFVSRLDAPLVHHDPGRLTTKYEALGLAAGRPGHYFKWRRNDVVAPNFFPPPEILAMPHLILTAPLTLDAIRRRFEPTTWRAGATHVRFIDCFTAADGERLLVETNVQEAPLVQRVALFIRRRRDPAAGAPGEYLIGLHELGFPRPTVGVHQAIGFLAHWLGQIEPRTLVVHSNLHSHEESPAA